VSFFRTLLWWLLLALLGALAWELFSPDPGQVLVRWQGTTLVFMSLAVFLAGWGLLWFLLWALWTVLRLPFTAWKRMAQTQARKRLVNGLLALNQGRYARAEALLDKAAEDPESAGAARLAARQAALRRGDQVAAALQQAQLAQRDPQAAALESAEALIALDKPDEALARLQGFHDRRQLTPRGLLLRGEALARAGRAAEAAAALAEHGSEIELPPGRLAALERHWLGAALTQSAHADELHQRWTALAPLRREAPGLLIAYARRAGLMGLEAEAAATLADAIERDWNETLVREFALLPPPRDDTRLARARAWLAAHPDSAALALCLGRLCRSTQQLGLARETLTRAIAQGAGSEAWEELGHVYTAENDAPRAQACYANALRTGRGEAPLPLGDRSLREQIADEAVAERRNEHGMPHLRE
jgi:HemY protein